MLHTFLNLPSSVHFSKFQQHQSLKKKKEKSLILVGRKNDMRNMLLWFHQHQMQQQLQFYGLQHPTTRLMQNTGSFTVALELSLHFVPFRHFRSRKVRMGKFMCIPVQFQAFWNEREETPWRSLTNPKKLSFPSECLIQSWRTTWTGTDGLSPSSCQKNKRKIYYSIHLEGTQVS